MDLQRLHEMAKERTAGSIACLAASSLYGNNPFQLTLEETQFCLSEARRLWVDDALRMREAMGYAPTVTKSAYTQGVGANPERGMSAKVLRNRGIAS